jgi:hypothetical protein
MNTNDEVFYQNLKKTILSDLKDKIDKGCEMTGNEFYGHWWNDIECTHDQFWRLHQELKDELKEIATIPFNRYSLSLAAARLAKRIACAIEVRQSIYLLALPFSR